MKNIEAQKAEVGMRLYPYGVQGDPENETWVTIDQIAPRDGDEIVFNGEFIFPKADVVSVEDAEQDSEYVLVPKNALMAYLGSSDAEKWPELARAFRHAMNPQVTKTYTFNITADAGAHDSLLLMMKAGIKDQDAQVKWTDA